MKQIAHKFGLLMMMTAALAVAGHIFQHCTASSAETLNDCRVCQSIMAASAHSAQPAEAELVFLRDAALPVIPDYFFLTAGSDLSRAPPRVFFS